MKSDDIMTGLIVIDESGDLGSAGSEYFVIAAIITFSPRNLKSAAELLPTDCERKWHNAYPNRRREIFDSLSLLRFNVVYSVVNKNHPDNKRPVYGNELYSRMLREVVSDSLSVAPCNDVNLLLDSSNFISIGHFRQIVYEEAKKYKVNMKCVDKIQSSQNKCIQLADFVAGASRSYYEYGDKSICSIQKKISVARRH